MKSQNNSMLISENVQLQYENHRKNGASRYTAIALIRKEYNCELNDEDDRVAVLAGLVLALSKRNELYDTMANETFLEIQRIKRHYPRGSISGRYFAEIEEKLMDTNVYGEEVEYEQVSVYRPKWMVGDVFSHTLTYPAAEKLGIMGWMILFYKVGDYVDKSNKQRQLMLVSLCSPKDHPSCYDDLKKIGFLPMMQMGERFEYLAQLAVRSKKEESAYCFTKIGNYKNSCDPWLEQRKKENPLTAMPLFGRLKRSDFWPAYEDQVCRLYRKFRKTRGHFSD